MNTFTLAFKSSIRCIMGNLGHRYGIVRRLKPVSPLPIKNVKNCKLSGRSEAALNCVHSIFGPFLSAQRSDGLQELTRIGSFLIHKIGYRLFITNSLFKITGMTRYYYVSLRRCNGEQK